MAEGQKDGSKDTNVPNLDKEDDHDEKNIESQEMDKLSALFSGKLDLSKKEKGAQLLSELSIDGIADYIRTGKCQNVLIMCGAGVSTSAGIPDFRSPGSGLYDNLGQFNLPDPQAIFEISFFRENPKPFYTLAKKLLPIGFKPTPCHYFIRLLHEKKKLLRVYTQNIDTLERVSGVPGEKIVEAHGTFFTSHCINSKCNTEYSLQWMKENMEKDDVPICPECGNFIKPDIVFFGENLPSRYFHLASTDFSECDLLIILGTSLVVQPFASLVEKVSIATPRLLINKEKVGQSDTIMSLLGFGSGLDYDSDNNYRDVAWLGLCDEGCQLLADKIGWGEELRELVKAEHQKIEGIEIAQPKAPL